MAYDDDRCYECGEKLNEVYGKSIEFRRTSEGETDRVKVCTPCALDLARDEIDLGDREGRLTS